MFELATCFDVSSGVTASVMYVNVSNHNVVYINFCFVGNCIMIWCSDIFCEIIPIHVKKAIANT